MSATFSDIIAYFKQLATEHIAIGHSESEKHFYRFELEEVLSGLGKVNYPALILEGYRYGLTDNKSDNVLKNRSGAFIILGQLKDIGDFDTMHELWDSQEEICDDIIARIKADKRAVAAVRDFDLNNVEVTLIANENDHNYGIRCTFTISSACPMDMDPAKWLNN